ncbi:unnamed protein product [Vitrella brassicaformis CCMP3155]|uniref:Peptidase S74 domain-containing protein n=2 Tax=Vitrella brassicaformis TaxID=1169539 RepID=A0A0G4EDD8_VITBC|nr:unnamed protein product [Vitrella brassicaformis CCMP3155]|eukprot:CEL93715.1 unnamed protein product [Vitrella brassicaformis CCMP3155]
MPAFYASYSREIGPLPIHDPADGTLLSPGYNYGDIVWNTGYVGCNINKRFWGVNARYTRSDNFYETSDARLKTNIQDLPADSKADIYDKFAQIRMRTFQWQPESMPNVPEEELAETQLGVLSQELAELFPGSVALDTSEAELSRPNGTEAIKGDAYYVSLSSLMYNNMVVTQRLQQETQRLQQELADIKALLARDDSPPMRRLFEARTDLLSEY